MVSVNLIKSGPPVLYIIHCTLYIDQFPVGEGGQTEWCICCSFPIAFAGGTVDRLSLRSRVVRVAMRTALAGNPCTIPFCRKREALDCEGGRHRQGRRWLVRTGLQNGISYTQGRALAGGVLFLLCYALHLRVWGFSLLLALARRRFRLAGQDIALTLVRWFSEMRVVSCKGGWPNGMVGGEIFCAE